MKPKEMWLSRDPRNNDTEYRICSKKMYVRSEGTFHNRKSNVIHFCQIEIERITGIKLKPGEQIQVKLVPVMRKKP